MMGVVYDFCMTRAARATEVACVDKLVPSKSAPRPTLCRSRHNREVCFISKTRTKYRLVKSVAIQQQQLYLPINYIKEFEEKTN